MFPPLRSLWLRLLGARIGRRAILHDVRFFNLYRSGFRGLSIGADCFLGDECLLDLAESVTVGDQVSIGDRTIILTHLNVGYADHPLQPHFPASAEPVTLERGCFVGAGALILPGVRLGSESFVAAGSVVTRDVSPRTLVAGNPAREIRQLD